MWLWTAVSLSAVDQRERERGRERKREKARIKDKETGAGTSYIHISCIYIGVFIYICTYIYSCIYKYIHTHTHTHTHVCEPTSAWFPSFWVATNSHVYTLSYMYIYESVCIYIYTYIYTHISILMNLYTYIYIYIYVYSLYIYIYIYTYIYIYVTKRRSWKANVIEDSFSRAYEEFFVLQSRKPSRIDAHMWRGLNLQIRVNFPQSSSLSFFLPLVSWKGKSFRGTLQYRNSPFRSGPQHAQKQDPWETLHNCPMLNWYASCVCMSSSLSLILFSVSCRGIL